LTVLYDKNEIFAETLLHTVKHQNKMGVVEKCYTVDILTVYRTYLPTLLKKNLLILFLWTQCIYTTRPTS